MEQERNPRARVGKIEIYCGFDELVDIEKVIPNPQNPNDHPESQVELLAKIIEAQGFRMPITVSNRSGFIVKGHGRLLAAKKLGMTQVPIDFQNYQSEAEEYADLIADNRLAELSNLNEENLVRLIEEIEQELPLELTGYDEDSLQEILDNLDLNLDLDLDIEDDDFDIDEALEEEPKSKPGEIYKLGNHRLMCGDSTKKEDVKKLMGGETADLLLTDPPYNVDYQGKSGAKLKIKNDNQEEGAFYEFLYDAISSANDVLKPGGSFYIWHADSNGLLFRMACEELGLRVRQCLIWVKNSFVMGRQDYHWKHEPSIYGWKDGAAHYFINDRTQDTVIEDKPNLKKMSKDELIAYIKDIEAYGEDQYPTTVMHEDKPAINDVHPTMKPVKLIARQVANSSRRGERVLDIFGGSGTTLIACEQLNRSCYTMELDPRFVDVIIKRWEEFTGEKAEKIGG